MSNILEELGVSVPKCIKCGSPAAFPASVTEPYTCSTCQSMKIMADNFTPEGYTTNHQMDAVRMANECATAIEKSSFEFFQDVILRTIPLASLLAAKAELEHIDEVLARRPALADEPNRYAKVEKAINVAKQVDQLRDDLAEEKQTVDLCWKALGIETYEQAKPLAISQHIENLRADNARLARENADLALQLGTQISIATHLEHALTTPNETILRCLENLNRNGSVSPQLAAEALAAIKGEA